MLKNKVLLCVIRPVLFLPLKSNFSKVCVAWDMTNMCHAAEETSQSVVAGCSSGYYRTAGEKRLKCDFKGTAGVIKV